jgi:hypothetical protein
MNRRTFFFSMISLCLAAPLTAFGQKGCEPDVAPHRHFLVLAGRSGISYDNSGPAFPMLINLDADGLRLMRSAYTLSRVDACSGPSRRKSIRSL